MPQYPSAIPEDQDDSNDLRQEQSRVGYGFAWGCLRFRWSPTPATCAPGGPEEDQTSLPRISTRRFGNAALSVRKSANRSFVGTNSGMTWIASRMSRCATGSPTKTTRTPDDVTSASCSCSAYAPD